MTAKVILRELKLKYYNEMEKYHFDKITTMNKFMKSKRTDQGTLTEDLAGLDMPVGFSFR